MEQLAAYDLVLPISQHSRNDLVAFLGAAIERPVGLEQFIKAAVLPGEFPECRRVYEPKIAGDTITVLTVGTVEPRKNHLNLLAAFAAAADKSRVKLQLVIAGSSGDSFDPDHAAAVQALIGHRTDIHWLQNVDDGRLQELYAECDFTIYPSIEEGFGLPILESLGMRGLAFAPTLVRWMRWQRAVAVCWLIREAFWKSLKRSCGWPKTQPNGSGWLKMPRNGI